MPIGHVTIIGCGNMAGAMAKIWLRQNLVSSLHIIKPSPMPDTLSSDARISYSAEIKKIETDLLIIGVKPQVIPDIADSVKTNLPEGTPVLSIAAGMTLKKLSNYFGEDTPIIRSMPNLPASIGKGVTASISNNLISAKQKEYAENLLNTCGTHHWVENEEIIDIVTAASASGVGFTYYFIEALTAATENAGMPLEMAEKIARQTIIGAAALAEENPDISTSELRENVTSNKGTTDAGLSVLMDERFLDIMKETVNAAKARSKALSQ